jgi:release factor glutamine methyltransferase
MNIIYLALEEKFAFTRYDMQSDAVLSPGDVQEWELIMGRLLKHEPIQYILGEADFYGLKFKVSPAVLIPRPETEELVHLCVQDNKRKVGLDILDIGTGSGCIAVYLKKELPQANVTAIDISTEALAVAKENAELNNVSVTFKQLDILQYHEAETLPQFDIIISNPPYIAESESAGMEANVLNNEPHIALFAPGEDALIFYRVIAAFSKVHLKKRGCIYLEINAAFSQQVAAIFRAEGYENIEIIQDMQGRTRMAKVSAY